MPKGDGQGPLTEERLPSQQVPAWYGTPDYTCLLIFSISKELAGAQCFFANEGVKVMASDCMLLLFVQPFTVAHIIILILLLQLALTRNIWWPPLMRSWQPIGVAGGMGVDNFPKKIVDATVQCVFFLPAASEYFSSNLEPS